jgi:hypothetical protein
MLDANLLSRELKLPRESLGQLVDEILGVKRFGYLFHKEGHRELEYFNGLADSVSRVELPA